MKVLDILVDGVIFNSRGEARRGIMQNAVWINSVRLTDSEAEFNEPVKWVRKGHKLFSVHDGVVSGPMDLRKARELSLKKADDMRKLLKSAPIPEEFLRQ